jgi:drug/metabolite transporter (DMT)-like permease
MVGKDSIMLAIGIAAIAAIGNATFAFGQKKSIPSQNPFIFLICTLVVCISLFLIASFFFAKENIPQFLHTNYPWFIISGTGFFLTFIGFYFLYTKFGTSYYVIYAVLSIITTSLIVGIILFKEYVNMYHLLSVCMAIITIVLFALGNSRQ